MTHKFVMIQFEIFLSHKIDIKKGGGVSILLTSWYCFNFKFCQEIIIIINFAIIQKKIKEKEISGGRWGMWLNRPVQPFSTYKYALSTLHLSSAWRSLLGKRRTTSLRKFSLLRQKSPWSNPSSSLFLSSCFHPGPRQGIDRRRPRLVPTTNHAGSITSDSGSSAEPRLGRSNSNRSSCPVCVQVRLGLLLLWNCLEQSRLAELLCYSF